MHSSELVFSPCGFLFDPLFFCCCTISGIPLCPHALPGIKFLPILVGAGEFLHDEHGVFCDDDKRCVGDEFVGLLGFGLGDL